MASARRWQQVQESKMRSRLNGFTAMAAATLMFGAGSGHAAAPAEAMAEMESILIQDPAKAPFAAVPGVPACVTMAPLRGSLGTGPASAMVRMKTGCVVPYHWHTPSEELIVLKGAPLAQMKGMRPMILKLGSYSQLPSRHVHRFRCTSRKDCIMVLVTGGAFDIHFVDDSGTEITTEAALVSAEKSKNVKW
jgi:quercetin dioxygenase-like cupin family protein